MARARGKAMAAIENRPRDAVEIERHIDPFSIKKRDYLPLVRRAAFLGREFAAQVEDAEYVQARGGVIQYVLDSNIFYAAAGPARSGALHADGTGGVGQFLPRSPVHGDALTRTADDRFAIRDRQRREDRLAVRATDFLARRIWQAVDSSPGRRPMALGPHFDEVQELEHDLRQEAAARGDTESASDARLTKDIKLLTEGITQYAKRGEKMSPDVVLNGIIDIVLRREALGWVGASVTLAAFLRRLPDEFDLQTFGKTKLDSLRPSGVDMERIEEAGHEYLLRSFQSKLERRKGIRPERYPTYRAYDNARRNARADAAALATLAVMNRRLLRAGQNARVVLITADRALVEATYRSSDDYILSYAEGSPAGIHIPSDPKLLFPEARGLDQRQLQTDLEVFFDLEGTEGGSNWFRAFGISYVRHIQGFAQGPGIDRITPANSSTTLNPFKDQFQNILSGLLAGEEAPIEDAMPHLEQIVLDEVQPTIPDAYRTIYEKTVREWNDLLGAAVKAGRVDTFEIEHKEVYEKLMGFIVRHRAEQHEGKVPDVKEAAAWLSEYVEGLRDRTMLEFTTIGKEFLVGGRSERHRWVARNPPDVRFFHFRKMGEFVRTLATPGHATISSLNGFDESVSQAVSDATEMKGSDRIELYLRFLALASAFAAAESWAAAEGHALRAISIVDRGRRLGIPVADVSVEDAIVQFTGREAMFLAAICAKAQARIPAELHEARRRLEAFRLACEAEVHAIAEEKRVNGLRHAAEAVSISQACYYLTRAGHASAVARKSESRRMADTDPLFQGHEAVEGVCDSCRAAYRVLLSEADRHFLTSTLNDDYLPDPFVPSLTDMSVSLSLIQLHQTVDDWDEDEERRPAAWQDPDVLLQAVQCLDRIRSEKRFVFSRTADVYLRLGKVLAGVSTLNEEFPRGEVALLMETQRRERATFYDAWRFDRLARQVRERRAIEDRQTV